MYILHIFHTIYKLTVILNLSLVLAYFYLNFTEVYLFHNVGYNIIIYYIIYSAILQTVYNAVQEFMEFTYVLTNL